MSFVAVGAAGICPRYFKRNRALASGVSVAGSSLGGVIWPVVCDQLLHKDGLSFDWIIRIVAFIMIPLHVIVLFTVRLPKEQQARGLIQDQEIEDPSKASEKPKVDRSTLRKDILKPPFILLCSGLFLAYLGFFSPFFYISTYATYLGMSQRLAFYLVSMVNGASLFGRILPGFWVTSPPLH
jgi:MFS family permease